MRIIVHFGMLKTGSTSIQKTFYQNRSRLTSICYPDFGRHEASHNNYLCQKFCRTSANSTVENKKTVVSELKKVLDLNASKNCDILLSAEHLSNWFNFNELHALHSVLVSYTKEVIAVGYIRSPKSYIESSFQQQLKMGKVTSFDLAPSFPYYQTFFEKFDQVFGAENVHFWKFDPASFSKGCVVTDFCQRLAIDIPPDFIVRDNEGLSLETLSLLYAYAKYRQEIKLDSRNGRSLFHINVPTQHQERKLRFASEIIAPLLEKNRQHIEWMETRMGVSLAEDIFKDDKNAIHSGADLLVCAPETTKWLAKKLGADYVKQWHPQMSAQDIAEWMHILRLKAAKKRADRTSKTVLSVAKEEHRKINLKSLVQLAKKTAPNLENLPDVKAVSLVREIVKQIKNDIRAINKGTLTVAGLGSFKVYGAEQDKLEQNVTGKQIVFEMAKNKKTSKSQGKRKNILSE